MVLDSLSERHTPLLHFYERTFNMALQGYYTCRLQGRPVVVFESGEIIFKMQGQSNVITDQVSCIHIFIQKKL